MNCTDVAFWTVLFVYFFSGDPVAGHGGKKSRFGRVLLTSVGNILLRNNIRSDICLPNIHISLNDFQTQDPKQEANTAMQYIRGDFIFTADRQTEGRHTHTQGMRNSVHFALEL